MARLPHIFRTDFPLHGVAMLECRRVEKLLEMAQEAHQLAATEDEPERKAGWVRIAALSLLLAERLILEMEEKEFQPPMGLKSH